MFFSIFSSVEYTGNTEAAKMDLHCTTAFWTSILLLYLWFRNDKSALWKAENLHYTVQIPEEMQKYLWHVEANLQWIALSWYEKR